MQDRYRRLDGILLRRTAGPYIALANKLARIAWSVLAHGRGFEASKLQVA